MAGLAGAAAPATAAPQAAAGPASGATLSFTAATNGAASLAPSGDRLVAEIQNVLWSLPRAGGDAVALTPPDLEPTRPVHSPDGRRIAVCAYRGGGFHLWTLRADGSGLQQLTDGPWDDRGPAWSPDGTRIAFASERGGDAVAGSPYRIWVLDVATKRLTRVTGLPGQDGPHQDGAWEDFDPCWSPDGSRIAFVRGRVADAALISRTVASVPADGGGAVRTEHTETAAAQVMVPALSPDGRLAYLRTTDYPGPDMRPGRGRGAGRRRRGRGAGAAALGVAGRAAADGRRAVPDRPCRCPGAVRGDPVHGEAAAGRGPTTA